MTDLANPMLPLTAGTRWLAGQLAAAVLAVAGVLSVASPGTARPLPTDPPLIVGNDYGGSVRDRLIELRDLRATGQRVEIRGRHCYSTCTMLLSLPNACISPRTRFGFHGPSRSGRHLSPEDFEFFSQLIARHYPQKLQDWYLQTGRNRIQGLYKLSGRTLIKLGAKAC